MEDLIPLIIVIGTLIISALGKIFGGKKKEEGVEADPSTVDRMLREMMHEAGYEEERPVAEEHRTTRSEHRPTASEHRPVLSERRPTASEHLRSGSETFATLSEHRPSASEHYVSAGEHRKGDVPVSPAFKPPPPIAHRRTRSKLGRALLSDLHGGAQSLARAIVLREILGPPVSLKNRADER